MEERFLGLLLPLAKRSMLDFGPVFERYALDLKREAEGALDAWQAPTDGLARASALSRDRRGRAG
jgi:hypothetical protein